MSEWSPEECGKCGKKATPKNIRSFVQSLWSNPPMWRCNDMDACKKRIERKKQVTP